MQKLPPNNPEAERHLLGMLILKPALVPQLNERLKQGDFYAEKHRLIYRAILDLSSANKTIDSVTIGEKLERTEGAPPVSYVASLTDGLQKSADWEEYFRIIREKAWCRDVANKARDVYTAASGGNFEETSRAIANLGAETHLDGQNQNIAAKVRDWIAVTSGYFRVTNMRKELALVTKAEREASKQEIFKLAKKGYIVKEGKEDGIYRRVETESIPIDFKNAPTVPHNVILPLGLNDYVDLYPTNIIVCAGYPDSGKTSMMLNIAALNMKNHRVVYQSSEMGDSEFNLRISKSGIPKENWNIEAFERSSRFSDTIQPDAINIIDYLEVGEEFWKVAPEMSAIHDKLKGGLAFIALQKNWGQDLGRGGTFSLEKPRLYLALDRGRCKIVKAKNWKSHFNPNGLVMTFKLHNGFEFQPTSLWRHESDVEQADAMLKEGRKKKWS